MNAKGLAKDRSYLDFSASIISDTLVLKFFIGFFCLTTKYILDNCITPPQPELNCFNKI